MCALVTRVQTCVLPICNGSDFDAAGVRQYASANEERSDHDPVTLAARGLLVEEQRTNLVPWSEVFDTPAWNKDTVTVVPNGAVAPDGTMTMDYIVPTANNNQHRILWRGNVTAATTYRSEEHKSETQ